MNLLTLLLHLFVISTAASDLGRAHHSHQSLHRRHRTRSTVPQYGIPSPIAAAWLYMTDDLDYRTIPKQWSSINFKTVDLLYVGPAGIQADGKFGLYSSNSTGSLANRFRWVIQTARTQNPKIKIIVSQWYSSTPTVWGSDLSVLNDTQSIDKYASSVASFVKTWLPVSGGIDGFDVDYEATNIVRNAPTIFAQVRSNLDALSTKTNGRRFYITVSPVVVTYLTNSVPYIDYANMQTYGSGEFTVFAQRFADIGFQPQQLLYGICPETGCGTKTVEEVEDQYELYNLTGIHLWRLNSDNYAHELKVQKQVFNFLHPRQVT